MRIRGESGESHVEAGAGGRPCGPGDGKPELVHTPGMKTIEQVANFLGVSPTHKIKTLAYMMRRGLVRKKRQDT